jgi:hypothetical protein
MPVILPEGDFVARNRGVTHGCNDMNRTSHQPVSTDLELLLDCVKTQHKLLQKLSLSTVRSSPCLNLSTQVGPRLPVQKLRHQWVGPFDA